MATTVKLSKKKDCKHSVRFDLETDQPNAPIKSIYVSRVWLEGEGLLEIDYIYVTVGNL